MSIIEIPFQSAPDEQEKGASVPLYLQLASRLEDAIHSGELETGSRIENEVAMAERLGLSRPTVRRAIQELVDKGLVVRRRRVGTQVVQGRVTRKVELTSLFDDLAQAGQHPSSSVLSFATEPADARVAAALDVPPEAPVLHVRRLRLADGVPVALLDNHLPARDWRLPADDLGPRRLPRPVGEAGGTLQGGRQTQPWRRGGARAAGALPAQRGAPA